MPGIRSQVVPAVHRHGQLARIDEILAEGPDAINFMGDRVRFVDKKPA
jgi:hypothetical protein